MEKEVKIVHRLARLNKENRWEPSTTRYKMRENGSMGVVSFDNEYDAIDYERGTRKGMWTSAKEHIHICSGTNPYDMPVKSYSSKVGLPIDFIIDNRPCKEIIDEILQRDLIHEGEWIEIECI